MPTVVLLGNANPQMQVQYATGAQVSVPADHLNQSVTRVEMWDGFADPAFVELTLSTDNDRLLAILARVLTGLHRPYAVGLYEVEQIVGVHAASVAPDWVAVPDNQGFADALAAYFNCPIGEPTNLLTLGGRDALHQQHLTSAAQPAPFFYGGLSANSGAGFAPSDTTLSGEIVTASGGLIRGAMTFAHTAGTNTSTLTKTWTANSSDVLPVTIASWANFNASSAGTMGEEDALNATATLNGVGDSITVTFTLTAG